MFKIDGVVSVEIASRRHAIGIARPECARRVERRETEAVCMFTESIDVRIVRKVRLHPQVLWLEYDRVRGCGKEYLLRRRAVNGEGER